jgi:hypothetical protein
MTISWSMMAIRQQRKLLIALTPESLAHPRSGVQSHHVIYCVSVFARCVHIALTRASLYRQITNCLGGTPLGAGAATPC